MKRLSYLTIAAQTAVWAGTGDNGRLDLFAGNENAPSQLLGGWK